jgi:NADPH:quinone reductase-like Zn-dependent oxidoreductase
MKAAIYTKYGPPEVVQVTDIPKPVPGHYEVLIRIKAATVNRTDAGFRSAVYVISRLWSGLFKPKYPILGCEFAGTIETIGSSVTKWKAGDAVFGYNDKQFGGHAEYTLAKESGFMAKIPENLPFETAAAITEGAHYALNIIRASKIKEGMDVMVYGATGAIGSAALQLLKYYNMQVTAVGNTKNTELLARLGADEVIDYQTQDFTQTKKRFDLIIDAVGKSSFGQCKPLLKENGLYISTELGKHGENVWKAILGSFTKGKRILFPIPVTTLEDIDFLRARVAEGSFTPVIDKIYSLEDITDAYRYVETEQKTGNVIIVP